MTDIKVLLNRSLYRAPVLFSLRFKEDNEKWQDPPPGNMTPEKLLLTKTGGLS